MSKIAVLGAGSWGITLARLLADSENQIVLWEFDPAIAEKLRSERELPKKLPDIKIPEHIDITSDITDAITDCFMVLVVVPSQNIRQMLESIVKAKWQSDSIICCASKGLEISTHYRMSQVFKEVIGKDISDRYCILSGPTHAEEVSRKCPTSIVAASENWSVAEKVQEILMRPYFRVYTYDDVIGVELGGAIKNVIAIAAGTASAMGLGDNAMAALITRALAEITRIGVKIGARPQTFAGLSGLGDLVVTCNSRHSRNRRFGELIGKGKSTEEALEEIGMVVEGISTARSTKYLEEKYSVELPISDQIFQVLFEGKDPKQAVGDLMQRDAKVEVENQLM